MKKLLLLTLLMLLLVSCKQKDTTIEEINLDGNVYSFTGEVDGYHIYQYNTSEIEVLFDGDITKMFFEIDEDLYIVEGGTDNVLIKKNGSTVQICPRESFECTGFEEVTFVDDIKVFYEQVEEVNE